MAGGTRNGLPKKDGSTSSRVAVRQQGLMFDDQRPPVARGLNMEIS
jgi:hypothetical protein